MDENWARDESSVWDFIKREEGMISGIRNMLKAEDEVSIKIGRSSLMVKEDMANSADDRSRLRSIKRKHLENLKDMILGQSLAVESGVIKADDIPTEYIVIFSIVLIASAGAFVAY